ncbi:MAG TPA: hypothetical protein VJB15_06115 [Rhodothermia bacterium]|nr:hypothetical protein [Rhodothermia bacterium]
MTRINPVHALGGGALAGVIINVSGVFIWLLLLGDETMRQLGRDLPGKAIPLSVWWGLLMGIVAVWLYVSLRAQYGAGTKTAALAGTVTWVLGYALPNYSIWTFGILDGSLVAQASAIGFVQVVLATLAGAALYNWAGDAVTAEQGMRQSTA